MSWQAQLLVAVAALTSVMVGVAATTVVPVAPLLVLAAQAVLLLDELSAALQRAYGGGRETYFARLFRYAWRRWPSPRRRSLRDDTIELLFWRGRFRWRNARRLAVVQDLTTRIHPELHTAGNIVEFDEFLRYVQRHAHEVVTVSEQSRRDIIDRIAVSPESVSVLPMPVHPQYSAPRFSRGYVDLYGITGKYVLAVGTIEPRKNLRRLVHAFDLVRTEDALRDHELVLVGPNGWDDRFGDFLRSHDVSRRVRIVGYAALEHLPSLYHYATVVVCPSVYEGFGLPVLEAMCSSAVVIASRVSALPEVLGDGIQFDPYDTSSIASALLATASMPPGDQAQYRSRNRRRAEMHLERVLAEGPLPGLNTPTTATPA
jgi:glycosyltransferase involved in cell wall biosynthesis